MLGAFLRMPDRRVYLFRTARGPLIMRPVSKALQEYARGVTGGLLFSLPLLYTMEVWWAGFIARPLRLLVYLLAGFLLLFGYNRYAGLREDASWADVAFEAVVEDRKSTRLHSS